MPRSVDLQDTSSDSTSNNEVSELGSVESHNVVAIRDFSIMVVSDENRAPKQSYDYFDALLTFKERVILA